MNKPISWDLYRTFLGVLNAGSLSAAARALDLTQPTVGRHIDELESALGLVLFTRSQAGLKVTEAASQLRSYLEAMAHHSAALERAAQGHQAIRGAVRIAASEVVGVEVLPPILARLRVQHPALALELVVSDSLQDLIEREADIAVRMAPPQQDVLLAQRIGELKLGMYAHTSYLQRRGTPASLADLTSHDLIGFDNDTPFLRKARSGHPEWVRENFAYRCDNAVAQLALIRAGAGIGICQSMLASRTPGLVRLLPTALDLSLPVWIAMHADLRHSPRCRAVFDGLASELRALLEATPQALT